VIWRARDREQPGMDPGADAGLPVPIVFLTMAVQPGISIVSIDNYRVAVWRRSTCTRRGTATLDISPARWNGGRRGSAWPAGRTRWGKPGFRQPRPTEPRGIGPPPAGMGFLQLLGRYHRWMPCSCNDQMALGAMYAAYRQGIRIPQELAVVGFDNLAESAHFWPPLTTIHQDQDRLGSAAYRLWLA